MALKLGELVAYLKADDDQFQKSLKKAQKDWEKHGEKLKDSAKVFAAAAAVAIGAGLVAGMDLDAARAKLSAQVGDPALAKQLGEAAGAVYGRGFGETAADAMLAARAVMQSGLLPKGADAAVIEDITVKAESLATVFDQDVTATARAAGQMIKTGMAGNASEAFDILTRGFQVSGDQADDLLDTFSEYSTKFRDIGLDGQQAMGLLTQGLQAGARDADTVADALKEFSIRAIDGSKTTAAGFAALGLSGSKMSADIAAGGPRAAAALDTTLDRLRSIKDPAERNAAAVALFGTKAEDLGDALFALDPSEATKALGEVGGAAGKMGDTLEETSSQKLASFKRQAQAVLVEKLSEAIPTIEKVVGWLKEHKAIVEPLAMVLGTLALVIGTIMGIYKTWIVLQTALNIVMMLNPIGLIVLAVIGLILIFAGLWIKFEGFRNFWKKTWEVIKKAALAVWDFLVAAAKKWWETFSGFWTGVGRFFKKLWDGIVDGVKAAWKWIGDTFDKVVKFVGGLPKKMGKAASGMWDGIKDSFKSAVNWIIRKWNDMSLTLPSIDTHIPGVGRVGGFTLNTKDIPLLANGGTALTAGAAIVGEKGPELLHMNRGATVQPLSGGGGGGHAETRLTGEFRVRGSDLVLVLRDRVALGGGNVQKVVGSSN